jgi:hypothetical protein
MNRTIAARVLVLGLGVALGLGASNWVSAQTPVPGATQAVPAPAVLTKATCLGCHQYDKVIAATVNYEMPGGEKHSPHRYIDAKVGKDPSLKPHAVTGVENIPECTKCHTAHALPHTVAADLSTIKLDWCYATCHHQENFNPCSECHN